jgi:hypothetical protein
MPVAPVRTSSALVGLAHTFSRTMSVPFFFSLSSDNELVPLSFFPLDLLMMMILICLYHYIVYEFLNLNLPPSLTTFPPIDL